MDSSMPSTRVRKSHDGTAPASWGRNVAVSKPGGFRRGRQVADEIGVMREHSKTFHQREQAPATT